MAKNSNKPINTFTLGFKDAKRYDERSDAAIMASFFSTNHREILIEPTVTSLLSKVVFHFDEPFGNPTSLLIHELTKEAQKYATVALAGDGGDEVFGGYSRYQACLLYDKFKFLPKVVFNLAASVVNLLPENTNGNHTYRRLKVFINSLTKPEDEMYEDWVACFSEKEINKIFKEVQIFDSIIKDVFNEIEGDDLLLKASITDVKTSLVSDLLSYGDAMSMANSFELRFPLLDHRILEFMASVSGDWRIKEGKAKYLMKKLLHGKIPEAIVNKPKLGLNPPMGIWLKKDLKMLVDNYLSKDTIKKRELLNYKFIEKMLAEHHSNRKDRSLHIWS